MSNTIKRDALGADIEVFMGVEVEKTVMHGKKTMFVVGIQDPVKVASWAAFRGISHIYLGANKSFYETEDWEPMVDSLLQAGLWVTFDFPLRSQDFVMGMLGNHMRKSRFIPMISVEITNVEIYNHNTTVKIDDLDMHHSNPGVWCHSLHDLLDRSRFTHWDEYNDDKAI